MKVRAALLASLLVLSTMSLAAAHTTYYSDKRWNAAHHTGLSITWRWAPNFPTTTAPRDRVQDGFNVWNALNQNMKFNQLAAASSSYTIDCDLVNTPQDYNGIYWQSLGDGSGGVRGTTFGCVHPGTTNLHQFTIVFDSSENWYSGANAANIPFGQEDLQGAAAHEVGHATGFWGHFPDATSSTGICWNDVDYQTMCNDVFPVPTKTRSLEEHDKHSFTGTYPP